MAPSCLRTIAQNKCIKQLAVSFEYPPISDFDPVINAVSMQADRVKNIVFICHQIL